MLVSWGNSFEEYFKFIALETMDMGKIPVLTLELYTSYYVQCIKL